MTTASHETRRSRVPVPVRGAQVLLLLPLGLLQLTAVTAFTIIGPIEGPVDWAVAAWAATMSAACIVVALRLQRRDPVVFRIALALLAAQAAFSAVKLLGYGESASLVFLALTVAAAGLLLLPASRRHFRQDEDGPEVLAAPAARRSSVAGRA